MSTEQTAEGDPDLARRVQLHAALADPARLRIVDALSVSDVSPTDLQRDLGIASNLLAHHLGVLQRAGLVEKHRSEADRRRTYLRLGPAGLDQLFRSPCRAHLSAPRVVFVCTANSARSQLAAALWNGTSDLPATSAGTHPADSVAPGAAEVAVRRGTPLGRQTPRSLVDVLDADDLLVTVCDNAHEELSRASLASLAPRALHWSVPDPVPAATKAAYDRAYDDLATRVARLVPSVAAG